MLDEVLERHPDFRDAVRIRSVGPTSQLLWRVNEYYRMSMALYGGQMTVICSGETPIAWLGPYGGWSVANVTGSQTTAMHQQAIREVLRDFGLSWWR